jgi:hypothetical protein
MDAVLFVVVAKSIDSGTQEGDVLAAEEVAVGHLVVVVVSVLTQDDAAGVAMTIAVAEPEGGIDMGLLLPVAVVSAERTKASPHQDLRAPVLLQLAGRARHRKPSAEHE